MSEVDNAIFWLGWINAAKLIGAFLVAIGVAAEFLGDWIAKPYEAVVEQSRQAEIARLTNENLRLEAQIEPRRLNTEQQKAISNALASFSGKKVLLRSYSFDTDGLVLGKQIVEALSPWIGGVNSIGGVTPAGGPLTEGVSITGSDAAFVNALTEAFRDLGKLAINNEPPKYGMGSMMIAPASMPPVDAIVFVGVKPLPP